MRASSNPPAAKSRAALPASSPRTPTLTCVFRDRAAIPKEGLMPSAESGVIRSPARKPAGIAASVGVAGRDVAGDLGAFGKVAPDRLVGSRRAVAVGLL